VDNFVHYERRKYRRRGRGGASYTRNCDRQMKEGCSAGAYLCEGFHEGDLEGGLLHWGTLKTWILRYM